jgi:hypothetical protein
VLEEYSPLERTPVVRHHPRLNRQFLPLNYSLDIF